MKTAVVLSLTSQANLWTADTNEEQN